MGGWSVLDYALNFATNPAPYLRLGYASYLSAWALVNSGTPESNYGYWYPGKANDGAAGGGFEPSANGRMWLVPSATLGRGSWFFASEIDLATAARCGPPQQFWRTTPSLAGSATAVIGVSMTAGSKSFPKTVCAGAFTHC